MCLRCRGDDPVQVNPENSSWRHPAEVTERQTTAKRIEHMRNLWKQKRKFNKRFARPAPVPEPGLLVSAPLKLTDP
ncbi:coiled-coil domain-containing protein 179 [Dama dama]|uniref:coiled-coil domain-containing protein 179 n=1 Tax=Dama dama TaxID=30532 RepID=UPI002A371747|nr:coiled-coil domain-containing protein 179 [Dama dama]